MTRFAITLAAALMASASAVTAMEAIDLDIDGDGFATKAEVDQVLGGVSPADFRKVDLNDDRRLSAPELSAAGVRAIIGRYEASASIIHGLSDVDTDGDRFASFEELQVVYPGLNDADFRSIDGNDDNRVSARELYSPKTQAVVTRYLMAPHMSVTIMMVDTDGDYFASFEELKETYPGLTSADFNQIDINSDNRIHSREYYMSEAQVIFNRSGR